MMTVVVSGGVRSGFRFRGGATRNGGPAEFNFAQGSKREGMLRDHVGELIPNYVQRDCLRADQCNVR